MALLDNLLEGGVSGVLLGVGVALAAPILLPAAATGARPLVKALIKGYLALADTVKEVVGETGEQLSDLVAEAQAERTVGAAAQAGTSEQPPETGHSHIITSS